MIINLLLIAANCSGGQPAGEQSDAYPNMGLITDMEVPGFDLTIDNVVGSTAPNFTWQVIDSKSLEPSNQSVSLTDLQGKPALIVFTYAEGAGCKECSEQMPFIEAIFNQPGQNLTVLNIYTDDNPKTVRDYTAKKNFLTFPALVDIEKKVRLQYCLTIGFPVNVLVDSQGTIKQYKVGRFTDQAELESWIDSL
jgi:peroxiredoxin